MVSHKYSDHMLDIRMLKIYCRLDIRVRRNKIAMQASLSLVT